MIRTTLSNVIDDFNKIDDLTDELLTLQSVGQDLAHKARDLEERELIPAESEHKSLYQAERQEYDRLARIVDGQPRAEVNRRNAKPDGWRWIDDAERKRLEAEAARVTPEEARLNELNGVRVRLPREKLDAIGEALTPLLSDVTEYERSLETLFSDLSEIMGTMHEHVNDLAQHSRNSFTFINANGIRTRLEHLRNGDALGEGVKL